MNNEGEFILTARLEDEDYELQSESEQDSDDDSDESSFESESIWDCWYAVKFMKNTVFGYKKTQKYFFWSA